MGFPNFQSLMAECFRATGDENPEQSAAKAMVVLEKLNIPVQTLDRDAQIYKLAAQVPAADIAKRMGIKRTSVHDIIARHKALRHRALKKEI